MQQVIHGWHEAANHKNKINIKIRYDLQDTERVVCKCASVQVCKWANDTDSYEVESNECVISDLK